MSLTIADALNKVRVKKSRLARVQSYIDESVVFYEDETPTYDYSTEMENREKLILEIRELKTAIQVTNAQTKVTYKGSEITLAELILINAELRSELAFQQGLLTHELHERSWRAGSRTKDEIKKKFADGYDKEQIRSKIQSLENDKEEVENLLNSVNAKTTLVEA